MNIFEFEGHVSKLFQVTKLGTIQHTLHAVSGVAGECGELLDLTKKVWIYNKPLDRDKVIEECGDVLFYMFATLISIFEPASALFSVYSDSKTMAEMSIQVEKRAHEYATREPVIPEVPECHVQAMAMCEVAAELLHYIHICAVPKNKMPLDIMMVTYYISTLLAPMAMLAFVAGTNLEGVMGRNVEKLNKRYPNGFTQAAAIARRDVQ